jgi:cysteine desulfurase
MFRYRREIYLDNNATTSVSPKVIRTITRVLKYNYGNPSSLYKAARDSAIILEQSREVVAQAVGARPAEIIFNGCASEGNNNILQGLSSFFYPKKRKIVATPIEHSSVMSTLEYLGKKGIEIVYCPVDRWGRVVMSKLDELLDDNTFLVCCMLANNEIGTLQDIKTISQMAKKKDILVMSDCVQALGKIKINVKELGVDYATFSGHKVHGPKGVGAIYIREESPFVPLVHGGHQEFGLRAGTESLHNIAGFAEACKAVEKMVGQMERLDGVRQAFVRMLKEIKPDVIVNSPEKDALQNTISITFPGINNAVIMGALDYYGISVSAGSACNTQSDDPSHVLKAIGLSADRAIQ